ncbi:hypothetical protein [Pseudochrobactrum sp. HB0163]|uniref:hypothetical protein n=1 Tax=Pseudochrobactrum sp. HB0163 TaxID=3450708 RepID=UPI003F6E10A1
MMFIIETRPSAVFSGWHKLGVDEMAATMQAMAAAGVPVTPDNLKLRGYSSEDITRYGLKAAHIARARAVKTVLS